MYEKRMGISSLRTRLVYAWVSEGERAYVDLCVSERTSRDRFINRRRAWEATTELPLITTRERKLANSDSRIHFFIVYELILRAYFPGSFLFLLLFHFHFHSLGPKSVSSKNLPKETYYLEGTTNTGRTRLHGFYQIFFF